MTNQLFLRGSAEGGLESNQDFTLKQYTYGANLSIIAKGWGKDSWIGHANILDYIPAALRVLSGTDSNFEPRGSAFPTFMIGFDQVMPQDMDPRAVVGDTSDFTRLRAEIGFRTSVGQWENDSIFLEANIRHYQEINASNAVKAADLDTNTFFTLALQLPMNTYVAYTTGKLPLDQENDQVYEAGFKYKF